MARDFDPHRLSSPQQFLWRMVIFLIIAGFVVPREGMLPEEDDLLAFARERLAAYKVPKQIWFLPALPRTANGKLIRKALVRP